MSSLYIVTLLNLFAEHIMQNAGLNDPKAEIKNTRRNINNLRYADDTTLGADSEEELKSFLIRVKEESEKAGMKLNIQKTKIMESGPFIHNKRKGQSESSDKFSLLELQNQCGW